MNRHYIVRYIENLALFFLLCLIVFVNKIFSNNMNNSYKWLQKMYKFCIMTYLNFINKYLIQIWNFITISISVIVLVNICMIFLSIIIFAVLNLRNHINRFSDLFDNNLILGYYIYLFKSLIIFLHYHFLKFIFSRHVQITISYISNGYKYGYYWVSMWLLMLLVYGLSMYVATGIYSKKYYELSKIARTNTTLYSKYGFQILSISFLFLTLVLLVSIYHFTNKISKNVNTSQKSFNATIISIMSNVIINIIEIYSIMLGIVQVHLSNVLNASLMITIIPISFTALMGYVISSEKLEFQKSA